MSGEKTWMMLAAVVGVAAAMMTVEAQPAPLRRPITSEKPIFIWNVSQGSCKDLSTIPGELRPFSAQSIDLACSFDLSAVRRSLETAEQRQIYSYIQSECWCTGTHLPAEYEVFFKDFKYCAGLLWAEGHGDDTRFSQSLDLCIKYGGQLIYGPLVSDTWFAFGNSTLVQKMRGNPDNMVFMWKFNKWDHTPDFCGNMNRSLGMGTWLTNVVGNWGVNPEFWFWAELYNHSVDPSDCPEGLAAQQILTSMLGGATVYLKFEAFSSTSMSKLVYPLLEKMVDPSYKLLPTKEFVAANSKILMNTGTVCHTAALDMIDGTLNNNGQWDFMPATGRYFYAPLYPSSVPITEAQKVGTVVPATSTDEGLYSGKYPQQATGNSMVVALDTLSRWVFTNPNIARGSPSTTFERALHVNTCESLGGTVGIYTYGIVDEEAEKLRIYCAYMDHGRSTTTTFTVRGHTGNASPVVDITGDGSKSENWNGLTKTFTLTVTQTGPVDIVIHASGNRQTSVERSWTPVKRTSPLMRGQAAHTAWSIRGELIRAERARSAGIHIVRYGAASSVTIEPVIR